jgi:hypothetical protein
MGTLLVLGFSPPAVAQAARVSMGWGRFSQFVNDRRLLLTSAAIMQGATCNHERKHRRRHRCVRWLVGW